MLNTALRTHPVSCSKVCDTFWAADCTAARTRLGGEAFINFDVLGAVPQGFVAELGSKLRPAGYSTAAFDAITVRQNHLYILPVAVLAARDRKRRLCGELR